MCAMFSTGTVVYDLKHLFEAAPQVLSARGFDTDLRRGSVLDPREDWEVVIVVVPYGFEALHHACENVRHVLVGFTATAAGTVVAGVQRDVPRVDGSGGLERRLDLREGATQFYAVPEQFRIIRAVDVHLEACFVGQHPGLPVLVKVLGLNHTNGLNLHGLKTEGDDVVHPFDDGPSLAGQGHASGSKFDAHVHPPSPPKWSPMKNPFR
jgi:hypothetical protein